MTNPTSYTDEQVRDAIQWVANFGSGYTAEVFASVFADRQRLQAEVEALRPDAERYRWLRDLPEYSPHECIGNMPGDLWDEAIDAARATPNETKETGHGDDA